MTPEAQHIAIAESQGWEWNPYITELGQFWGWFSLNQSFYLGSHYSDKEEKSKILPDYLSDLNAVREVVKTLTNKQADEYILRLCAGDRWKSAELNIGDAVYAESAPADERVEHILKTLKLWTS